MMIKEVHCRIGRRLFKSADWKCESSPEIASYKMGPKEWKKKKKMNKKLYFDDEGRAQCSR